MTTYHLGDVKPWVSNVANILGPKFGIRSIGGWRAHGSVPGSDHPKGLALDMMTNSKAVGDRLAEYSVANYKALGIKYVIWYRRIWTPSKGWHDYDGPSDHTDHVHLSFNSRPGTGKLGDIGSAIGGLLGSGKDALSNNPLTAGLKGVADELKGIGSSLAAVGKMAELITSAFLPNNIVRGVAGLAGTLFILIGIYFLSREARSG